MSAWEAHVINVTAKIENALSVPMKTIDFGTVFPEETFEEAFTVSLSDSFIEQAQCSDVNLVKNGGFENPEVNTSEQWDIFESGTLGLEWIVEWEGGSINYGGQDRPDPALQELHEEGGIQGRARRYQGNYEALVKGMRGLGFEEYLQPEVQGYIITSFRYPTHPRFDFESFYTHLNQRGFVIYPGKVSNADCFRIGNIGRLFQQDILELLEAIKVTLADMGIEVPL